MPNIIFITSPPLDTNDYNRYEAWLEKNGFSSDEMDYPFLLSPANSIDQLNKWEKELSKIGVPLYVKEFHDTDTPDEAVFILGKPDYKKGCSSAKLKYVKWLQRYLSEHCDSIYGFGETAKLADGDAPICLGTITVRNTDDRLPLINEISAFGPVRLEFINIQNPWVD